MNLVSGTTGPLQKFAIFGSPSATQASAVISLPATAKRIMISLAVDSMVPAATPDGIPLNVALTVNLGTGNSFRIVATNLSTQTAIDSLVVRWWAVLA